MITFAGVELLLEDWDGEVTRYINRYLEYPQSLVNPQGRMFDSEVSLQRPIWPARPPLKPNQLFWPTGATRWSQFMGLATTDQKNQIVSALPNRVASADLVIGINGALPINIDSGEPVDSSFNITKKITASMFLLQPYPISLNSKTLWIIPLVDDRYWWQQASMVSTALTWDDLLGEIENSLATIIDRDTTDILDSNYGIPDSCFFRNGSINTATALDALCWSTNRRLVSKSIGEQPSSSSSSSGGGTWNARYILRSMATANTIYNIQRLKIDSSAGNEVSGTTSSSSSSSSGSQGLGDTPVNIEFIFTSSVNYTDPIEYSQPTSAAPDWADGGTMQVTCHATFNGNNETSLNGIADRWSADFWKWTQKRFVWGYIGAPDWRFSGYEDYALVDMSRITPDHEGEVPYVARTFVKSMPVTNTWYDYVPIQLPSFPITDCDNELRLFIALGTFQYRAYATTGVYLGDGDASVAMCAQLNRNPILTDGSYQRMTYFREDGWAIPVWSPATTSATSGVACGNITVVCGSRLWARYNPFSLRWELVSVPAPLSVGGDSINGSSGCPCAWFGYATWKVISGPAWQLVSNRCSGCYGDNSGRGSLDSISDQRFLPLGINEDWIESPSIDPPAEHVNDDWLYVTCCAVTDPPPPDPCDLTCCYSFPFPIPKCNSEDPDGSVTAVMKMLSGGAGQPCILAPINTSPILLSTIPRCYSDASYDGNVSLTGGHVSGTTLSVGIAITPGGNSPTGIVFCRPGSAGAWTVNAIYSLESFPDCEGSFTATLGSVIGPYNGPPTFDTMPYPSGGTLCCVCGMTYAYVRSLFPGTITLSVSSCTPPTTTTPSPTTTTPVPTTTTGAPTTTTLAPTTTTGAPTTTTSSPTTTTGAPTTTTGAPTTTSNPCTGDCNYIGVTDGCGGSPTGFSWSGNGNTCSGVGCGCPSDLCTFVVEQLGWPDHLDQPGSLPCRNDYP